MSEEQQQEEVEIIGPGRILKEARLKAGLSVEDIARSLHLRVSNIRDIESDKYDDNISVTFTKGYIKLYAKHINMPIEEVLEAFEKYNTKKKEPAKLQSFSRRVAQQANDDRLMLITYLVLAVVVALVVIWWFQQSEKSAKVSSSISTPTSIQADQTDSDNELDAETRLAHEQENIATMNEALENTNSEVFYAQPSDVELASNANQQDDIDELQGSGSEDAVVSEDILQEPAQVSEELAAPVNLVFEFAGDCWMNLVDATGEAIAYGVKAEGRVMPITGIPPFDVTLGAPEVVKISYAGEAVDMSVFKAGNTAKFSLPVQRVE